jgi:DNA adenine methylase
MTRPAKKTQPSLFDEPSLDRIVNVASVPQRSPFRYPGGKTWLVPRIRYWLEDWKNRHGKKPAEFIEPFAGGAIVSLTVAAEKYAEHVTMIEIDEQVAAVWKTILQGDAAWLADKIVSYDLTPENVEKDLSKPARSIRDKAFQTILKNRVYRGGILAPGSGMLKYGEDGKGIKSRWYPDTLKKRILGITSMSERISFIEGDGIASLRDYTKRSDAVFFIDPPYTAAGKKAGSRLYAHYELDHEELFRIMKSVSGDFLMTYDDADEVREMANKHGFDTEIVAMKNTHHAEMTELLIGRSLDWARGTTINKVTPQ